MILVLGATGFLGKNVCIQLNKKELKYVSTSKSLGIDLRDYHQTLSLFETIEPDYIINCAAYVGGIQFGYKYPVELYSNNLKINLNILEAAQKTKVKRIVNPISNCVYPAEATLFKEEALWNGPMHESVLVYGFVRKAFLIGSWAYAKEFKMDVLNLILSNMYGPEDHFEEERSHALGALVMKFERAKRNKEPYVNVWGTGKPVREWLHVHDGAEALIRGLSSPPSIEPVNIGVASGISIIELANLIKEYIGYEGDIKLDSSKPDGAEYKTVDGTQGEKLLGWKPQIQLKQGIKDTINWYLRNSIHES